MHPYRIFISYAHHDSTLASTLANYLHNLGLNVSWDEAIDPGRSITDDIKKRILRSHLFLPLLTENSSQRPWVHQETGLAVGLSVPCLPVATSGVPEAIIRDLKAAVLGSELITHTEMRKSLTENLIRRIAERRQSFVTAPFEIAESPELRTKLIASYAEEAYDESTHGPGRLRLRGSFSSFCLPDEPPDHVIWRERDGLVQRSHTLYEWQWKERRMGYQFKAGQLEDDHHNSKCPASPSPAVPASKA